MLSVKHFCIFFFALLIITIADYYYLGRPAIGIDDSNIFLNYAHHISQGNGFRFNIGGEKVEGFTSMLWVLICACFYCISSHPEGLLLCFSFLITTLTVTLVYEEVSKNKRLINSSFAKKTFFAVYLLFIICIGPSFIAWSVLSLMENAVWNLLFLSIILCILKCYRTSHLPIASQLALLSLMFLLILCRPEALLWGIIFTIMLAWVMKKNGRSLLFPVIFFVIAAGTAVALTYFRLQYFGYPFPNTYYAKVSSNRLYNIIEGGKYAVTFIIAYHPVITFLLAALMITSIYRITLYKTIPPTISVALNSIVIVTVIVIIGILLPLTTGGDHFGGFRFYQGILLLFAWGIPSAYWLYEQSNMQVKNAKTFTFLVIIIFLLLIGGDSLFSLKNPPKRQLNYEFTLSTIGRDIAKELNANFPKNKPTVGVIAAGGFGLEYNGTTIDLMGLNNTLMGHSKGNRIGIKNHAAFNKDIFYQLHANLILPAVIANSKEAIINYADMLNTNNFDNEAMKNIFNDTLFQQHYKPIVFGKKNGKEQIFTFAEQGFLNKLEKDSSFLIIRINL